VYDIINQLIDKGFCETVPGVVKKFKAVDPESAIKNLIEHQKKQEQKMLRIAEKLQLDYNNKKVNTTPLDYVQVLTSRHSQVKKFQELVESAREFIMAFTKKPYAINPDIEDVKKVSAPFKKIIDSGVIVKTVYEADNNTKHFTEWVSYFQSIGEQIRIAETLPMKMLISDNDRVMISLRNQGAVKFSVSSMVVKHSDLTTALIKLFEFYWDNSMTVDEYLASRN
jgi:HTH-type transcriptional regulator, sugar sensing transcriptional regulator